MIENYLNLIVLSKLECSLASFLCAAGTIINNHVSWGQFLLLVIRYDNSTTISLRPIGTEVSTLF